MTQSDLQHFDMIVGVDATRGIGMNDGTIPWHGTAEGRLDMKWFRAMTRDVAVIMGRKTWDSIGRPLPGRINIVMTRADPPSPDLTAAAESSGIIITHTLDEALREAQNQGKRAMVIGGAEIYALALAHPCMGTLLVNELDQDYGCEVKFPLLDRHEWVSEMIHSEEFGVKLEMKLTNKSEESYLALLRELRDAPPRPNRTAVPTRGVFHRVLSFPLSRGDMSKTGAGGAEQRVMPLITTKKMNFAAIYHELIWFLRGSTTTEYLRANGVHIWDGNSTRDFLDSRGLVRYKEGEVGPIYGYQWRRWGRKYDRATRRDGLPGDGTWYDQLAIAIHALREDPSSRRMLVSAWNPSQLGEMALPPCHYSFQFHCDFDSDVRPSRLNCLVNMRSADVGLGVPFNIASYALLTHMISHIVGIPAGTLAISMADCHIYESHIAAIDRQLQRAPRQYPTLRFGDRAQEYGEIDDFARGEIDDVIIENYMPHPHIKMDMAV